MANKIGSATEYGTGKVIPIPYIDNGDGTYSPGVNASGVVVGDITVVSVPIKDGSTAVLANVDAPTNISVSSKTLGTHDPMVGQIGDVLADGTMLGFLYHIARPALSLGIGGAAYVTADAQTIAAVTDAPGIGKNLIVSSLLVSSNTANITLTFTEETSGKVLFKVYATVNQQVPLITNINGEITLSTATNKRLMVQADKAGAFSVTALWHTS